MSPNAYSHYCTTVQTGQGWHVAQRVQALLYERAKRKSVEQRVVMCIQKQPLQDAYMTRYPARRHRWRMWSSAECSRCTLRIPWRKQRVHTNKQRWTASTSLKAASETSALVPMLQQVSMCLKHRIDKSRTFWRWFETKLVWRICAQRAQPSGWFRAADSAASRIVRHAISNDNMCTPLAVHSPCNSPNLCRTTLNPFTRNVSRSGHSGLCFCNVASTHNKRAMRRWQSLIANCSDANNQTVATMSTALVVSLVLVSCMVLGLNQGNSSSVHVDHAPANEEEVMSAREVWG